MLLTRNLIYTAMTRAKKLLIVIGPQSVVSYMIQNNTTRQRNTGLNDLIRILLLRELIGRPGFPGFRPPRPPPPPPPRPPRPPMRPPMGPGPRPPRPRGDMSEYNRQYFDRFDDSCELFEY